MNTIEFLLKYRLQLIIIHYSYSFTKKAKDNNLVVIGNTKSTTCCTNKVYINLMIKNKIRNPEGKFIFKDESFSTQKLIYELSLINSPKNPLWLIFKRCQKKLIPQKNYSKSLMICLSSPSDKRITQKYYYTDFELEYWNIKQQTNLRM